MIQLCVLLCCSAWPTLGFLILGLAVVCRERWARWYFAAWEERGRASGLSELGTFSESRAPQLGQAHRRVACRVFLSLLPPPSP